jgi:hypothetical protein
MLKTVASHNSSMRRSGQSGINALLTDKVKRDRYKLSRAQSCVITQTFYPLRNRRLRLTVSNRASRSRPAIISRFDGRHPYAILGSISQPFNAGYGRSGTTWNAPKYCQLQLMQCARHHAIFPLTFRDDLGVRYNIGHREQISRRFDGRDTVRQTVRWPDGLDGGG